MSDDLAERLRGRGMRLTAQRVEILRAVETLRHATPDEVAEEVRRQGAEVSLSTVYRGLEVLEELGLVRHAHLSDRAPTYHSVSGHEHFHLVCRACGRVISVDADELEPFVAQLQGRHGFSPDVGHLTVFGQCGECE